MNRLFLLLALCLSTVAQAQVVTVTGGAEPPAFSPVASVSTDLNQGGSTTLLPFASTTGMAVGQVVAGTSITDGATVASIVSTAQTTLAANGSFAGTQKVIPMAVTTSFAVGQQCHDNTLGTVIGDGNVIASIQAAVSITMTSNVNASSGAVDSITCDPVVTLSAATTGTISAGAGIKFYNNATAATSAGSGTFVVNGGEAVLGQAYFAGQVLSTVATGTAPLSVNSTTNVPNLNASTLTGSAVGASGATIPLLNGANTWSGVQTITNSDLALLGSSTGKNTLTASNASAANYTTTVPAVTGTLPIIAAQTIASATTTDIGSACIANAMCVISGTTTITSLGSTAPAGSQYTIQFSGALTLTNGANLVLPGAANFLTAANVIIECYVPVTAGTWYCTIPLYNANFRVSSAGSIVNSGFIQNAGLLSTATKFTTSGCSVSATTGGATAGTFTLGANTCTVIITLNGATGLTAANGWVCSAEDQTALLVLVSQSASSTTTCSLNIPATAGATDVIRFMAMGY